ncbi:hypothetical protein GGU10DRAFT_437281 [Lentinula aff. detonsa]|uniref:Uncharacterized protein n=1 Tax=Lentinula aff. detonsa TaxID=2804958 RepID=A0AA38L3D9_9AGAR|nr:hypothetical protein GGU10DRAFT_437281 [Lentinula aff. detonsa]
MSSSSRLSSILSVSPKYLSVFLCAESSLSQKHLSSEKVAADYKGMGSSWALDVKIARRAQAAALYGINMVLYSAGEGGTLLIHSLSSAGEWDPVLLMHTVQFRRCVVFFTSIERLHYAKRYRPHIPHEWGLCRFCETGIEDECHALLTCTSCSTLSHLRKCFLEDLFDITPFLKVIYTQSGTRLEIDISQVQSSACSTSQIIKDQSRYSVGKTWRG